MFKGIELETVSYEVLLLSWILRFGVYRSSELEWLPVLDVVSGKFPQVNRPLCF